MPSRQLGQNFLIDANVARWIVDQLEIAPGETVVEVGPGTGALTEYVVEKADHVVLVEFDARLAAWLKKKFAENSKVEVHHADGAQFDVRTLFQHRPIKFLGNLPYSAGGAIMRNFLRQPTPVSRAVLMLQKEVIDRLVAVPRTKDYGVLTLRVQSEWCVKPVKVVPPEAFHPRPQIDSSVAVLTPRGAEFPVYDARLFDELVRRGFAQRRKQIKKQLPESPGWEEVAGKIGVPVTARAEEISLPQWVELTRLYDSHPLLEIPQRGEEIFDVVDEKDEVIGTASRDEVHERDLKHRAVHVLVFNKKKEVLLQKRSRLKDRHPSVWDSSSSGHLDSGEGYEAAAIRELDEELGIDDAEVQEIAQIDASEETGWEFVRLFVARHDGAVRVPASEVEAFEWFPQEILQEWIAKRGQKDFAPGFLRCWREFRDLLASTGG